jgi:hypothetical protein
MRVNDVIMIRIDGAIESTVNSTINWIARSVTPPPLPPRLMLISCANAGAASAPAAISVAMNKTLRGARARFTKTTTSDVRAARPSLPRDFQNCFSAWAQAVAAAVRPARCAWHVMAAEPAALAQPAARRRSRQDDAARPPTAAPSRRDSGPRSALERAAAVAVVEAAERREPPAVPLAGPGGRRAQSSVRCAASGALSVRDEVQAAERAAPP